MTQDELAVQAEVHRVTVANLEAGRTSARFSTIRKLAKVLGVDPQLLLVKGDGMSGAE